MHAEHMAARKRETVRNPVTDEGVGLGTHDLALADIFASKTEHELFVNYFLPAQDEETAKEIIEAQREKRVLTDDQERFLEDARVAYNRRRAEAEQVQKHLTPDEVGEMAERDEGIRIITGKIGKEPAAKFLTDHIAELAMTDHQSFRHIANSLRAVHSMRNGAEAERVDKLVAHRLKKYNIADDAYRKAVASGSSEEIKQNFQKIAAEQLTGFRASLSFIVKRWRAAKLYQSFEDEERLIKECNSHLAVVAGVLRSTLDPEMRHALHSAASEGRKTFEKPKGNVLTVDEYRNAVAQSTPEGIKRHYTAARELAAKKKFGDKTKWDGLSPAQKAEIETPEFKNNFLDGEERRQKGYKGKGLLITRLNVLLLPRDKIQETIDSIPV